MAKNNTRKLQEENERLLKENEDLKLGIELERKMHETSIQKCKDLIIELEERTSEFYKATKEIDILKKELQDSIKKVKDMENQLEKDYKMNMTDLFNKIKRKVRI